MTTGAEVFLAALRAAGVDWMFCNPGTDFPPVIEAVARGVPAPRLAPVLHENVAVGMAHGFYLATGRTQAAMVHVNVGTANALMGLVNAHREHVPLLLAAGRTPVSENGRPGSRGDAIHWGQEMFDQAAMLREVVKWDYELRDPGSVGEVVARALAVATSPPRGPVYLSLPREVLAEPASPAVRPVVPATLPAPDPDVVAAVAERFAAARRPIVVTSRGGPELFAVLSGFADRYGLPVTQMRPSRLSLPTDHPLCTGTTPDQLLAEADLVLVLDTLVPWLPSGPAPNDDAYVVHVGPDPMHAHIPLRSFRTDIAVTADPATFLHALADAVGPLDRAERRIAVAARIAGHAARAGDRDVLDAMSVSRVLDDVLGDDGIVVSELGARPAALRRHHWDGYFGPPVSGGLGWGLPAALGVKLADPARLVVATVGDGSYVFANPSACHHAAATLGLGLVTVVFDNGRWNAVAAATTRMYPDGAAAAADEVPLSGLGPRPDYVKLIEAYGGRGERVDDPRRLAGALEDARNRAVDGQQSLVAVTVP
jgi:acetolactate synthase I/II/III large subunit